MDPALKPPTNSTATKVLCLVLAVYRSPAAAAADVAAPRRQKTQRLAFEAMPARFVLKLRVCQLTVGPGTRWVQSSGCHLAQVVFRSEVTSELAIEDCLEDAAVWPPLLKIQLTSPAWAVWQASLQLPGYSADASDMQAQMCPKAVKAKPKGKAKSEPKAACAIKSWSGLDGSFFCSRGWTAVGKEKLRLGVSLVLQAHQDFIGIPYIVDGRIPEHAGGHEYEVINRRIPSFFENACGKDVGGTVPPKSFSLGVHCRLVGVRKALEKKDARPLHRLMRDIFRYSDDLLD